MRLVNSWAYMAGAIPSCWPQTTSVGAWIRCIRFFSPLSGMGQVNFPVQPRFQVF